MNRAIFSCWAIFLILSFGLTACSDSGISTSADYRQAAKKFEVSKVSVIQSASTARTAGDPPELRGALERLVPAVSKMHAAAHGIKVADAQINMCHGELLAAVDAYKGFLDGFAPGVLNTPIPKAKTAMKNALTAFNKGIEGWKSSMAALP